MQYVKSLLNNNLKKLKEKYEKDKVDDQEKLLQELKGKCETTHHQLTNLSLMIIHI